MTTEFKNEFKTEDANSYNSVVGYFDQYTERFTSHMPEPMLAAAGLKSAARVLDVGTGTGVIALDVVKRLGQGTEVVGIDLSDGMLATADAKARAAGLDEQVSFLKMDAENLDFEDESFDAVLSLYALRHFPNPDKALQEMFRVLKPGGAVVVAVGSSPSLFSKEGVIAAFRRIGSILRKSTGRELSACEFIDHLVEKHLPAREEKETTEWTEHHHGFSGSLKSLVEGAGFVNAKGFWKGQYSKVTSAEDFWLLQMTFSSLARKRIGQAAPEKVEALKQEFMSQCEAVLAKGGRLVYQTGGAVVAAAKPGA